MWGSMTETSCLSTLIKLCKKWPNVYFVLCGNTLTSRAREFYEETELRHTSSQIWFLHFETIIAKLSSAVLVNKDWEFRKSGCYKRYSKESSAWEYTTQTVYCWGFHHMTETCRFCRDETLTDTQLDLPGSVEFL